MRRAHLAPLWGLEEDSFSKLRLNSPDNGWFPILQDLNWYITETNLPYADLFFSPHLKRISIHRLQVHFGEPAGPLNTLPVTAIASAISTLPTSALQSLRVFCSESWSPEASWTGFTDSLSSVVLRCGQSLTEFISKVPLSDTAVNHLTRLPLLRTCRIEGPPPGHSVPHSPLVLPPLVELELGRDTAREWVSLFERLGGCVDSLSKVKESLKSLDLPIPTIDASFVASIQPFHNLVNLRVDADCYGRGSQRGCTFKLNNDNVAELTMALSQLESLLLGRPCSSDACATTAACLLSISVHCAELRELEIHFNATNIVDDLENISDDPRFQELRSRPRCQLLLLNVYRIQLTLDEPGLETVMNGMLDIFPSLGWSEEAAEGSGWGELSNKLWEFQDEMCTSDMS